MKESRRLRHEKALLRQIKRAYRANEARLNPTALRESVRLGLADFAVAIKRLESRGAITVGVYLGGEQLPQQIDARPVCETVSIVRMDA